MEELSYMLTQYFVSCVHVRFYFSLPLIFFTLLTFLFYIGMPVVRTDGLSVARAVYSHVITKFSRMGRLPHFLSYGAPPTRCALRRVWSSAKNLSESHIETLKDFYKHYQKKFWYFKKSYKRFKLPHETITISGMCLVIIGAITGGITLNPIILGVVNGAGVLVASIGKMKIEMSRTAFTTYEKVLV